MRHRTTGKATEMMYTTNPQGVAICLRQALADSVAFSYRAHGFHWNVTGPDFQEYHALFDAIYSDVDGSIDQIAESILKVGSFAPFNISEFAGMTRISQAPRPGSAMEMIVDLLAESDALLASLFECFKVSSDANEQGIANFMAERIDMVQKWRWQLRATAGMQVDILAGQEPRQAGMALDDALAELRTLRDNMVQ